VDKVVTEISRDHKLLATVDLKRDNESLEHLVCEWWNKNDIYRLGEQVKDGLDYNKMDCEKVSPIFRLISSNRTVDDKIELIEYL